MNESKEQQRTISLVQNEGFKVNIVDDPQRFRQTLRRQPGPRFPSCSCTPATNTSTAASLFTAFVRAVPVQRKMCSSLAGMTELFVRPVGFLRMFLIFRAAYAFTGMSLRALFVMSPALKRSYIISFFREVRQARLNLYLVHCSTPLSSGVWTFACKNTIDEFRVA